MVYNASIHQKNVTVIYTLRMRFSETQQHQNCISQSCSKSLRFFDQRPFLWTRLREGEYVYGCHCPGEILVRMRSRLNWHLSLCPSYSYFVKKSVLFTPAMMGHEGQIALTYSRGIIRKAKYAKPGAHQMELHLHLFLESTLSRVEL